MATDLILQRYFVPPFETMPEIHSPGSVSRVSGHHSFRPTTPAMLSCLMLKIDRSINDAFVAIF